MLAVVFYFMCLGFLLGCWVMATKTTKHESTGGFHGGPIPAGDTIGELVEEKKEMKDLCKFKQIGLTFNGVSYTTDCGHTLTIVNSKKTYLHCPFCGKLRNFIT